MSIRTRLACAVALAVVLLGLTRSMVQSSFTATTASGPSRLAAAAAFAPVNVAAPRIAGVARVGHELTALTGTWRRDERLDLTWERDGVAIPEAHKPTHTPGVAGALRLRVTAHGPGGTATALSEPVHVEPAPPVTYEAAVLADEPLAFYRMQAGAAALRGARGTPGGNVSFGAPGPIAGEPQDTAATVVPHGWATIDGAAVWNGGRATTVELWFRTSRPGMLLGFQNAPIGATPSQYQAAMYVDGTGRLRGGWYDEAVRAVAGPPVTDGRWHHAVLIRRPASITLVLDGADLGTVPGCGCWRGRSDWTAAVGSGTVSLGWPSTTSGVTSWRLDGQIDEVAVYDGALAPERIAAHAAASGWAP